MLCGAPWSLSQAGQGCKTPPGWGKPPSAASPAHTQRWQTLCCRLAVISCLLWCQAQQEGLGDVLQTPSRFPSQIWRGCGSVQGRESTQPVNSGKKQGQCQANVAFGLLKRSWMGGGSHTSAARIPRMCLSRSPHTSSPQWAVSVVGPIQKKKKKQKMWEQQVGIILRVHPKDVFGSRTGCERRDVSEAVSQSGSFQGRSEGMETPKLRINFRT